MRQHRGVPSSQSTSRRLAGVVAVAFLAALPATASAGGPLGVGAVDADLRIETPEPGYGVALTALTIDGRSMSLTIETDSDGITRIVQPSEVRGSAAARVGIAGGKAACADGKHSEIGFRWTRPWAWRFRASSTPAGLGRAVVERQLRAAVRSITGARNDCGRPDRVSARAAYLGRTSRKPMVRSDTGCGRPDGHNVVGFGTLPRFIAGVTCTVYAFSSRGWARAIESDVLFNKRHHSWATSPKGCSGGQVILRSVATHEFGHVFGLSHVKESTHGNLTMSESLGTCDDSAFTLGKGDIIGLERLY
jgi:hypothetical protein